MILIKRLLIKRVLAKRILKLNGMIVFLIIADWMAAKPKIFLFLK